jgi:farnesyl-diphosphate farnesyltransferase
MSDTPGDEPSGGVAGTSTPTDADRAWTFEAVESVSRTFALSIELLEEPVSSWVCTGYLLCRIADTVEDAAHIPPPAKRRLLETYRETIDPDGTATPEEFRRAAEEWAPEDPDGGWQVVARAPRVIRAFRGFDAGTRDAMRPSILEMIDGMEEFVRRYADEDGVRIGTLEELEDYSWYVAGTVSTLVTNLLAPGATEEQERAMRKNAEDFALLLQLVNVTKDARQDYREENNVYLPRLLLDRHDLEPSDIDDPEKAAEFAPVIRAVADHAEGYADGAEAWIEAMPDAIGVTLPAVAVPFLLAIATIRELKSRPEDVIAEGELKVEREEVLELLERFHTGEPSVSRLRETMRERPLQEH